MNSALVLDTSVIVKWLNRVSEQNLDNADKIMEDALSGKVELVAPELSKYEVGNVMLLGKKLTPREAAISLATLYSLPIAFVTESQELAKETFTIASSLGVTYYDAAFISLAKQYGVKLITDNVKHQGKAKDVEVIPLSNYPLKS